VRSTERYFPKHRLDRRPHGSKPLWFKKTVPPLPGTKTGNYRNHGPEWRPHGSQITLAQACEGLVRYKTVVGLSPHTIADYKNTFKKLFLFFRDEIQLEDVIRKEMVDFFAWL
jgi:hypothetical protein